MHTEARFQGRIENDVLKAIAKDLRSGSHGIQVNEAHAQKLIQKADRKAVEQEKKRNEEAEKLIADLKILNFRDWNGLDCPTDGDLWHFSEAQAKTSAGTEKLAPNPLGEQGELTEQAKKLIAFYRKLGAFTRAGVDCYDQLIRTAHTKSMQTRALIATTDNHDLHGQLIDFNHSTAFEIRNNPGDYNERSVVFYEKTHATVMGNVKASPLISGSLDKAIGENGHWIANYGTMAALRFVPQHLNSAMYDEKGNWVFGKQRAQLDNELAYIGNYLSRLGMIKIDVGNGRTKYAFEIGKGARNILEKTSRDLDRDLKQFHRNFDNEFSVETSILTSLVLSAAGKGAVMLAQSGKLGTGVQEALEILLKGKSTSGLTSTAGMPKKVQWTAQLIKGIDSVRTRGKHAAEMIGIANVIYHGASEGIEYYDWWDAKSGGMAYPSRYKHSKYYSERLPQFMVDENGKLKKQYFDGSFRDYWLERTDEFWKETAPAAASAYRHFGMAPMFTWAKWEPLRLLLSGYANQIITHYGLTTDDPDFWTAQRQGHHFIGNIQTAIWGSTKLQAPAALFKKEAARYATALATNMGINGAMTAFDHYRLGEDAIDYLTMSNEDWKKKLEAREKIRQANIANGRPEDFGIYSTELHGGRLTYDIVEAISRKALSSIYMDAKVAKGALVNPPIKLGRDVLSGRVKLEELSPKERNIAVLASTREIKLKDKLLIARGDANKPDAEKGISAGANDLVRELAKLRKIREGTTDWDDLWKDIEAKRKDKKQHNQSLYEAVDDFVEQKLEKARKQWLGRSPKEQRDDLKHMDERRKVFERLEALAQQHPTTVSTSFGPEHWKYNPAFFSGIKVGQMPEYPRDILRYVIGKLPSARISDLDRGAFFYEFDAYRQRYPNRTLSQYILAFKAAHDYPGFRMSDIESLTPSAILSDATQFAREGAQVARNLTGRIRDTAQRLGKEYGLFKGKLEILGEEPGVLALQTLTPEQQRHIDLIRGMALHRVGKTNQKKTRESTPNDPSLARPPADSISPQDSTQIGTTVEDCYRRTIAMVSKHGKRFAQRGVRAEDYATKLIISMMESEKDPLQGLQKVDAFLQLIEDEQTGGQTQDYDLTEPLLRNWESDSGRQGMNIVAREAIWIYLGEIQQLNEGWRRR
ncbi:MAG: hypothetical protein HY537_14215 [Deltaproteobacteria bacterium]|nr:hypothetical protein [Deltaproteobacteria bacterium]